MKSHRIIHSGGPCHVHGPSADLDSLDSASSWVTFAALICNVPEWELQSEGIHNAVTRIRIEGGYFLIQITLRRTWGSWLGYIIFREMEQRCRIINTNGNVKSLHGGTQRRLWYWQHLVHLHHSIQDTNLHHLWYGPHVFHSVKTLEDCLLRPTQWVRTGDPHLGGDSNLWEWK